MKIEKVHAREILDSRGNPTVEVEVTLENGVIAVQPFRQEHLQAKTRHWNFATATRTAILARAC